MGREGLIYAAGAVSRAGVGWGGRGEEETRREGLWPLMPAVGGTQAQDQVGVRIESEPWLVWFRG